MDLSAPGTRLRIDDLDVDVGRAEVTRSGAIISLPKLSFDLLCALIDAAPGIASVDHLLQVVWPGLVVSPETVAQRVKLLRDAIGDDPKQPRYILGVRGRGYRLIPEIVRAPALAPVPALDVTPSVASPEPLQVTPELPRKFPARSIGVLLVVAAAIVLSVIAIRTLSNHAAASRNSIAVLPFADMSENGDQQYFSDGMTEELIDQLTKIPELRVPARTSSFYFKGKQATIAEIAKALGVTHVLEGSVRKSGDTIRITAELVRVDGGYHLWSQTFDRQLGDVFKIQDDIAESVVTALKVSLLNGPLPQASATTNPDAYTLYLKAQSIRHSQSSSAGEGAAIDYLHEALELDPQFAPAWGTLATALAADFSAFGTLKHDEISAEAHKAADQARRLDPALPLGHIAKGRVLYELDWNWPAAEAEIRQSMELEPGNAEARRLAGYIATTQGRYPEAIRLLESATTRDPLEAWNYIATGYATLRSGKLAETEANYRKAIDLNPTANKFHFLLGQVLLARGQPTEALVQFDKESDPGYRQVGLALAMDASGRRADADRELALAEERFGNEKAYWIACLYASRKDPDRAFAWLDRAFANFDGGLLWILGDPALDNLKGDPRYGAFLRKMKLQP